MKKNKRFEISYEEKTGMMSTVSIIKDRKTGVQYLFTSSGGYPGGLTVLLDKDGKPLLDDDILADDDLVMVNPDDQEKSDK